MLAAGEFAGTLQGAVAFCAALPALPAATPTPGACDRASAVGLASRSDVYAVYCKLHLARRATKVGRDVKSGRV